MAGYSTIVPTSMPPTGLHVHTCSSMPSFMPRNAGAPWSHAMSTGFPPALGFSPLGATRAAVLFSEMLAVQRGQPPPAAAALAPSRLPSCLLSCLSCLRGRAPRVEVLTFRRSPASRCEWAPRTLVLEPGSEGAAEDWVAAIGAGIEAAAAGRPK